MARYRDKLPQLSGEIFLTDSGLETDLIFHKGVDLPCFAAFPLLDDAAGRGLLDRYFADHAAVARAHDVGFVLESATWRASPDWGALLGYTSARLEAVNREAIATLTVLRKGLGTTRPVVISGCIGPRGDGYPRGALMTADEARAYHGVQVDVFAGTDADLVSALTLNYPAEAIGVARAAEAAGMPVVISFTVETDGALPGGVRLASAIDEVDEATGGYPAYYMVNCAHPTHLAAAITGPERSIGRIRGIRANASRRSHAELDEATSLDDGDPAELGREYVELRAAVPGLTVLGGCCGTDLRHVEAIAGACLGRPDAT